MKKFEPIFYYMSLSNMLFFLGNSFFILLPVYFKSLGATETYIGFMNNIDKAFMIATALSLGSLIYGRDRVQLLRYGYAILLITYCSYLFIGSLTWYIPMIRIIHGIGFSIAMIVGSTIVFENVSSGDATEAIGIYGVTGSISNAVSTAIGEYLLSRGNSFQLIFILAIVCILASLFFTLLIPRKPVKDEEAKDPAHSSSWSLLKNYNFLMYSLAAFIFGGGFGVLITFFPNFIRTATTLNYSYFFIIYIGMLIFIRLVFMQVVGLMNKNLLVLIVFLIGALMNILMNWLDSLLLLVIVSLLYGIIHGILYPVLNAHLVNIVPISDRGRANALFSAIFNGGMLVFACGLGYVIDYFRTYLAAFNFCGAAFVVASVLIALVQKKHAREISEKKEGIEPVIY